MATYAFSDVHGHCAPLVRLLDRVSPCDEDAIYMLGDMIDRGPDPLGVVRTCRELPGCTVLMGNHEDLMLSALYHPHDRWARSDWTLNGGMTTAEGLSSLPDDECLEIVDWVSQLPLYARARVGGRDYLLVHAGINALRIPEHEGLWEGDDLDELMGEQLREDVLWIREDFWGRPTGLVDGSGRGPIVVAGHTPSVYLSSMGDLLERPPRNEEGLCRIVKVGGRRETHYVPDRWDIDSGAAGGHGFGQVSMVRLDDGEEFYEPIGEGE